MTAIASEPPPLPFIETVESDAVLFHPVATWKFILLSVLTLGLYEFYWCYKCWEFVKVNGRPEIHPFWRAVFAPLWLYNLQKAINSEAPKNRIMRIALLYFVLTAFGEAPDPYGTLSYFSFLALLPIVGEVNRLNRDPAVRVASSYARFGWKHWGISGLGMSSLVLTVLPIFNIVPDTQIVEGTRVPERLYPFLGDLGIYSPDEEIVLFYSAGIFSFKEEGQFFTEKRVACYEEDWVNGGYSGHSAYYSEIQDIEVGARTALLGTKVTVLCQDGKTFSFVLPDDSDRDDAFIRQLQKLWSDAKSLASVP